MKINENEMNEASCRKWCYRVNDGASEYFLYGLTTVRLDAIVLQITFCRNNA